MGRRQFYPKQEILSKDFNQLRNSMEVALWERFIGKSIPKLPAFVGSGFEPKINGNTIQLSPGIGFQFVAQTDGSTNVRVISLSSQMDVAIALPAAGVTEIDLIEVKSILQNQPTELRTFKVGAGSFEDRATAISNQWGAQVQILANVTVGVDGHYDPSNGFVAICAVKKNHTGILEVTDLRSFYNLFEPSFFNLFGRKNISFSHKYDGVNLVEVPWEFSSFVPKVEQISIRKFQRENYGGTTTVLPTIYSQTFGLTPPVGSIQTVTKRNFLGYNLGDLRVNYTGNRSSPAQYIPSSESGNLIYLNSRNLNHLTSSVFGGLDDDFYNILYYTGRYKNNLAAIWWDDFNDQSISDLSAKDIYILFWKSSEGNPSLQNAVIYKITPAQRVFDRDSLYLRGVWIYAGGIAPIYKSGDISTQFNRFSISTENPLTQSTGEENYVYSGSEIAIPNFYTFKDINYNPNIKKIDVTLKDTTIMSSANSFVGRRDTAKDLNIPPSVQNPHDITTDGTTLWVLSYTDEYLRAFSKASLTRDPSKDIDLSVLNHGGYLFGVTTDGTTIWVTDNNSSTKGIYAFNKITKARDSTKDIDIRTLIETPENIIVLMSGLTTDGTTMWVIDSRNSKIRAINIANKTIDATKEISLENYPPRASGGLTTNGTTLWVATYGYSNPPGFRFVNLPLPAIQAYSISTRNRDSSKDINNIVASRSALLLGLTTDNTTLWVCNQFSLISLNNELKAYELFDSGYNQEFPDNVF